VLANGTPTDYGQLINGWLTDPMCLTLCMAILLVANQITGDDKYAAAYNEVHDIYGSARLYKYPKASFLTWNNWNDDFRASIHLSILADFEAWDDGGHFKDGLRRLWKLNKNQGNAFVAFLVGKHINIKDEIQPCIKLLNEFYVEEKNNIQKANSSDPFKLWPFGIEIIEYSPASFIQGDLVSTQPWALWQTGMQDFMFQRRLYSLDNWVGNTTASQWFFGTDYLFCYWGFKQLGWL
jgi:hypothetical protein